MTLIVQPWGTKFSFEAFQLKTKDLVDFGLADVFFVSEMKMTGSSEVAASVETNDPS